VAAAKGNEANIRLLVSADTPNHGEELKQVLGALRFALRELGTAYFISEVSIEPPCRS
jgi:hypothetical protein